MFLKTFLQTPYLYILKLGNFKLDLIISGKCGINYNVNGRILIQADNVFKTDLKCCRISFCICIVFVFIYLPHDYNNYKKMPKKM